MLDHIRSATLAGATAALGAALLEAPAASADDVRPCVSRREFNLVFNMADEQAARITQAQLERRWEVTGLGVREDLFATGNQIGLSYPACAFDRSEAQVFAVYRPRTSTLVVVGRMHMGGAPHGHV